MAVFAVDEPTLKATTKTDVICLQILMVFYGIAIPILLYYTRKYYKFRNLAPIKARRPNITLMIELLISAMFMNRIIYCFYAIHSKYIVLRVIFILINPIINHGILWLFCIKYWLLYYDIQVAVSSEGNQWSQYINPHNVTYLTNWYIVNKQKLGSERFLIKKFIFTVILIPIIIVPISHFIIYTSSFDLFIDLFFMIIPLVLVVVIWNKTPKYLDYFRVREECRMLVVIGICLIIMFLILGFITTFLFHPHDIFIVILFIEFIYLIGIFIVGLHLTFWTLLKNQHRININQKPSRLYIKYRALNRAVSPKKLAPTETIQRKLSRHQILQTQSITNTQINDVGNESILLLISILQNEHGFQLFLSHLLTEFCLESALAIIEFTQYQILMKQIYSSSDLDLDLDQINILKLPDIVPKSVIVYDPEQQNDVYDIKNIAKCLLKKYIENGAQFEVNISWKLKRKLLNDLENIQQLNQIKLVHLFDECIQSLLLLLNDSLSRFIKTAKYKQIEKELAMSLKENEDDNDNDNDNDYVAISTPNNDEPVMRLPSSSKNNDLSSPIMRDDQTSNHSEQNQPKNKPDFYTLESTRL